MAGENRGTPVWLIHAQINRVASCPHRGLQKATSPYPPSLQRPVSMPPRPRRTTRAAASASVTSASVTASPTFSVRSSKESTPATSAVGDTDKSLVQTRRSSRKSVVESKKRYRESDEEAEEDTGKTRAKRREVDREVYVEIQVSANVRAFS